MNARGARAAAALPDAGHPAAGGGLIVLVNTVSLYRQALRAVDTAYDRTLLASAKSIGEQLEVNDGGELPRLRATVPYSALEAFEADNRSRMFYRVTGFDGEMVSGFADLPFWRGKLPQRPPYAALVDFYDDRFRDGDVRVAVLLQPVAGARAGHGHDPGGRDAGAAPHAGPQILVDTVWRQALLVGVIALVAVVVVQRATRPVRRLSASSGAAARATSRRSPRPTRRANCCRWSTPPTR